MVGKLHRIPLREVFDNEPHFTKWLEENIDVLNDAIGLQLGNVEREKSAGQFSADLLAEDQDGNFVVIENQLEKSNHDHLGKLITYLTALDARTGVWIVSDPRPEHVAAIGWLNESSPASFYLLKVEAIQIGESESAPLLTLITGPSEEARDVGKTKKELADRYPIRERFWGTLLERMKGRTKLFTSISPSQSGWISTGAGKYGIHFNFSVRQHDAQVELYIDRGKGADEENKTIFDKLFESKDEIETAFQGEFEWQRLDDRRACRIRKVFDIGGYRDEDRWSEIQDTLIDAMVRLHAAMKPHIAKLNI